VVLLGAESSGTTTLASDLAAHYRSRGGVWARTRWVAEFGRELTVRKLALLREGDAAATIDDLVWTPADFAEAAREQDAAEERAARAGSPLLVCDTDSLATALWEERYLGATSADVAAIGAARRPALYLLTDCAGVPFEDDGLRDGEHLRDWMTARFRDVLAAHQAATGVPYLELTGSRDERLARAIHACDALLARGWPLADPLRP
jgi:nicotinamide riboside kinase